MRIVLFLTGLFVLALGLGYLYRPEKIQRINCWLRDNLFNDRLLVTHRRRAGTVLLFIGIILIFFATR